MNTEISNTIIAYLARYEPKRISVFGSYARNEQTPESDLDLMVSFGQKLTLLDLSKINRELGEKLNLKIDLVTEKSVSPKMKPYIEHDLQIIYHAKE
jgi:predicted nucleotidyltransferase